MMIDGEELEGSIREAEDSDPVAHDVTIVLGILLISFALAGNIIGVYLAYHGPQDDRRYYLFFGLSFMTYVIFFLGFHALLKPIDRRFRPFIAVGLSLFFATALFLIDYYFVFRAVNLSP